MKLLLKSIKTLTDQLVNLMALNRLIYLYFIYLITYQLPSHMINLIQDNPLLVHQQQVQQRIPELHSTNMNNIQMTQLCLKLFELTLSIFDS